MIKSFSSLFKTSLKKTTALVKNGKRLSRETDRLCSVAEKDFVSQTIYPDNSGYDEEIKQGYDNAISLMRKWEGDLNEDKQ